MNRMMHKGTVVLQRAAVETGNGSELIVTDPQMGPGYICAFQVVGLTNGTIVLEATIDGDNWVALECVSVGDTTTGLTAITGNGIYRATVAGVVRIRARIHAWVEGEVYVYALLTG
jgi:hypothetical protein